MEMNKQIQKAGDGSQQYQIENFIFNQGISEERARQIFKEMIPEALEYYKHEAAIIAIDRINTLEERMFSKIHTLEPFLQAFRNPAFQIALRKAQLTAAACEYEEDFDLLSELLVYHVKKGNEKKYRAAINKSIEIVGQVDNDALCALTVSHVIGTFFPHTGSYLDSIIFFNDIFNKLIYHNLPIGSDWLDHLDVFGAIRMLSFGNMKKIAECYSHNIPGFLTVGIKIDSEDYNTAIRMLDEQGINRSILIQNDCLDGYVRLNISNETSIDQLLISSDQSHVSLTILQKQTLKSIMNMYVKDTSLETKVKESFIEKWDSYETLHKLRLWWESIPYAFHITQVGLVLAQTNAKRCWPEIPDLFSN